MVRQGRAARGWIDVLLPRMPRGESAPVAVGQNLGTPGRSSQMNFDDLDVNTSVLAERSALIALEIARGLDPPREIAARHGLSEEAFARMARDKAFRDKVKHFIRELRTSGVTFRTKAVLQAELLLREAYLMAVNTDTPAHVRADLIKWHATVADLMPRHAGHAESNLGFAVQINFTGGRGEVLTGTRPAIAPPDTE